MDALEIIKTRLTPESVKTLLISLGFNPHGGADQLRSRCEVHGGDNPTAFSYSLKLHMWHCHNCGAGGDVVQLIQDMKKIDFKEAVTFMLHYVGIDDINGIEIISRPDRYYQELQAFKMYALRKKKSNRLYELPQGTEVKRIATFRNFTQATMDYFDFGFVSAMPFEKTDGTFGTIHNRLAMPILFEHKTVGYAFRRTNERENPKWLFQPAGLDKRNLIYNLEKRWYKEVILCEGQFDVWAYHQTGLRDVGCTLGASITKEQENILMRCTDTLIIAYDNDEAGQKAIHKAIEQCKHKFNIYIITYPEGAKDPCDISEEALMKCYEERLHYTKWLENNKI